MCLEHEGSWGNSWRMAALWPDGRGMAPSHGGRSMACGKVIGLEVLPMSSSV